jgi:hypothetical protein
MRRLFLIICFLPSFCYAFNFVGHITVAETAYQLAPGPLQAKLKSSGDTLYAAATPLFRRSLKPYQGVSSFSKIAFLPDTVTSDEVGVVFDRFNAALPSPLRRSRKKTSANWHYINYPFDKKNGCGGKFLNRSSNIEWALKKLIKSYKRAKDDNARALTLAFIVHLVADAHQPLHTVAMDINPARNKCESDLGGNLFCLSKLRESGKCPTKYRLHRYWDQAAYRISDRDKLSQYTADILAVAGGIDAENVSMKIKDWTAESHKLSKQVYDTPKDQWPSVSYEERAYVMSVQRMALAAVRLERLLAQLL